VFFGATGDLAYKKIFPALQGMVKRGHLDVPVIGVAKAGWGVDELRARARNSVEQHGGLDAAAFDTLCRLLRYVDGDYRDPATFQASANSSAQPSAPRITSPFREAVRACRGTAGPVGPHQRRSRHRRKAFGRDLTSARALNRTLFGSFDEKTIFRIDHYLGKRPVHHMLFFRLQTPSSSPSGTGIMSRVCRSPWPKISGSRAGARSTTRRAPCATSSRIICSRS